MSGFLPCFTCAKDFNSIEALKQHKRDLCHIKGPVSGEEWSRLETIQSYFKAYYEEKVMLMRTDRRAARREVKKVIGEIRKEFREEDGEDLYTWKIKNAGSTATQTKVYLADEFDFNINIDIGEDDLQILNNGAHVWYNVDKESEDGADHLAYNRSVSNIRRYLQVPPGYAAVRILNADDYNNTNWWENVTHKRFIIPRSVQEDLYQKVSDATDDDPTTSVSARPHGPAITMNIKSRNIGHDISVDFVAAIQINETVQSYGWPRQPTWRCLHEEVIQGVLKENLYLIPKHNNFWYISFGNAAKTLMRSIDRHGECRLTCHRILKSDFIKWKSAQSFQGVSTFMFKNHLFWFNERILSTNTEYWKDENIGQCYVDLLIDLARCLEEGEILNYFNAQHNILEDKDPSVLRRLANKLRERKNQLLRIRAV